MLEHAVTRSLLLALGLAPFAWYAYQDNKMHFSLRRVSRAEHLLHLLLGLFLVAVIGAAFRGQTEGMVLALGGFCLLGAADEYGFHRDIPSEEHDCHAKEHFGLLVFVVVVLLLGLGGPTA